MNIQLAEIDNLKSATEKVHESDFNILNDIATENTNDKYILRV